MTSIKFIFLVLALVILSIPGFDVWKATCASPVSEIIDCGSDCRPDTLEEFRFTIPVGSIVEVLKALGIELPTGPLVIPDIEVELSKRFGGHASVNCLPDCCPDAQLVMGVDLILSGDVTLGSIPPYTDHFSSLIPVISRLYDNAEGDANTTPCSIAARWEYTLHKFKVTLVFAGGLASLPLSSSGVGTPSCRTSWGCKEYDTRPMILFRPQEIPVPIGGRAEFTVVATMYHSYPLLTAGTSVPYTIPLKFKVSPPRHKGVTVGIESDRREGGRIIPGGKGWIEVAPDSGILDGTTEEITVTVCDPRDELHRCDRCIITIRYVTDHPPQAISTREVRSHGDARNQANQLSLQLAI